jgi:diguanylate cyclase (GGDEF)-like protein
MPKSSYFLTLLEKQNKSLMAVTGFALICILGVLDFLTGYEIALSLFYVIPVCLVSWTTNRTIGLIISLFSAIVWLWADLASGHFYQHPFIPIWNALAGLSVFVIFTLLLTELKSAIEHEKELARTDNLTGAVNSRFFHYLAQIEIDRSQRFQHPFTIAYIDLDNFKTLNDQFGHTAGDHALRTVVSFIKNNFRKTDVIARLGGDEFAVLLPETDEEFASELLCKIQKGLLEEMKKNNWPVTFSVGVLICKAAPASTDDLLKMADELMYSVKNGSKNAVKFSIYKGPTPVSAA